MAPVNIGERVGAILSADRAVVKLLGYGVYEGNQTPDTGPFGMPLEEFQKIAGRPYTNPRIKLDNGKTIWGYQCWWGPEQDIKAAIAGRMVEHVDIEEAIQDVAAAPDKEA